MSFSDFIGNRKVVEQLRLAMAHERLPHAVILAGPHGAGKFTLAQMLAKTANCLNPPKGALPDFCGVCENCRKIAEADDVEARIAEAIETREDLREADKRETRIFVQTHPDVLIIPPDPPQNLVKVDQVRRVRESVYLRPLGGRKKFSIFPGSAFMKEAANALLKVLEEPPEFATLVLVSANASELLPTIRSRCIEFQLAPLPAGEVEAVLAKRRPELNAKQRALVARLSRGAIGRAEKFDLAAYSELRGEALMLLGAVQRGDDHSEVFRATERYRSGAEAGERMQQLVSILYSLLEDLMFLRSGAPELIRNTDVKPQLEELAHNVSFEWLSRASHELVGLEHGVRRNLLRSLALDSFAASLEQ